MLLLNDATLRRAALIAGCTIIFVILALLSRGIFPYPLPPSFMMSSLEDSALSWEKTTEQSEQSEAQALLVPVELTQESFVLPFNSSQLDSVQCIPKVCKQKRQFTANRNFTLLASFPGSGNTWARTIIESGSRIYTGSVFHDHELFNSGFKGELMDPYSTQRSRVSAIKTHYPYFLGGKVHASTTASVVVMRNPFDAILAEFSRRAGRGSSSHTSQVTPEKLQRSFPNMFQREIPRWRLFSQTWYGAHARGAYVNRENGVTSLEYKRDFGHNEFPVLVMFYEDFVREPVVSIYRMMAFIKLQMQDTMPTSALEAMVCALIEGREHQKTAMRKHKEDDYDPYADKQNAIARRDLIKQACRAWEKYWFEDIWGNCMDRMNGKMKRAPKSQLTIRLDEQVVNDCM